MSAQRAQRRRLLHHPFEAGRLISGRNGAESFRAVQFWFNNFCLMENIRIIFVIFLLSSFQLFAGNLPAGWVIGWGDNVNGQATGDPASGLYATGLVEVAGSVLSNAV